MAKKIIHSIIPLRGLGLMAALSMAVLPSAAQKNGITDTGKSKYAVVSSTPLSAVNRRILGRALRSVQRHISAEHVGDMEV